MNAHDLLPALLARIEAGAPERQALFETVMSAPQCVVPAEHLLQHLEWALYLNRIRTRPILDTLVPTDYDQPAPIVSLNSLLHDMSEGEDEKYRKLLKALR